MIKILVDAMGGDNAPGEIVKGALQAARARSITKTVSRESILFMFMFPFFTDREFYLSPAPDFRLCCAAAWARWASLILARAEKMTTKTVAMINTQKMG